MLAPYIVWSVVYFGFCSIWNQEFHLTLCQSFLKDFFIKGYEHLWFMHAIVIAVFIVCLLLRVMKPGKIYVLGVCILLLGLMCDTYYPVFQNIGPVRWIHSQPIFGYLGTRNALFYGVPYVCMGHYFANHEFTHKNRNQSIIRMFACSF